MPDFMRILGSNMPLTLANTLLEKLVIYNSGLDIYLTQKLIIIFAILFIFLYISIKRKPTVQ